jgi:fermentation-respiration switch protein FrsA (DUF1100 family)
VDWYDPHEFTKRDLELKLPDGTLIHAWWCPKVGADGALIHAHGNGGNLSHRGPTYALLQQHLNLSVLAFDYPGYGKSGGSPSEAGCYEAGEAAWQWLTTEGGVAPERIVLFGESLGGGIAAELAQRHPSRAIVLFCAFTSAPDVGKDHYPFLPVHQLMRTRFDNLSKIGKLTCPVFIAHGDSDTIINPSHAQRLFDAAAEPKALHWIRGADHNDPIAQETIAALRQFLTEHAPR